MSLVSSVKQTSSFQKAVKKLHKNQKKCLDKAVMEIMEDPYLGGVKKGDLDYLRVYRFKMVGQLILLGYSYDEFNTLTLTLMAIGTRENFYRDFKRSNN